MDIKNRTPETLILSELEKLIRLFSFYPAGHDYLKVASARILNAIKQQFGALKSVIYTIDRRHVFINDTPLDGFDKLSKLLFYKRIKTLILHSTVKSEELLTFIHEVSTGDLILPRDQSIKQILFKNNITGIEVEEVDYDTIREELDNDMDQQTENAEEEVSLENVVQDLTDDEQEAIRLINLIEKEEVPQRYNDLSDALAPIIDRLSEIERYEIPLIAIRTYTQHAYQKNKDRDSAATAKSMVETVSMGKGMIPKIIDPIVTGNPYYYESSIRTIRIIGEPALEELTGIMIKTDTLQSIKFIARALSVFQKQAYGHLKNVILSDNYKSAIVAIDTAVHMRTGSEPAISSGLTHKDMRIRKRAVQALFEINTAHGNNTIEKLLTNSKDQRMTDLVISMVGKYKRQMFIPWIKHIIADPAVPYSIKQDALLVLGELGSKEATRVIIESVFDPALPLPKQYPEIRLAGIKALGTSMNEIAIANLVQLLESKEERIRAATWNTLNEIGKKINA
jgi:hypothetical protein